MATPEQTPDTDTVRTNTDFPTQTPEGSDYDESDSDTGGLTMTMTTVAILTLKKDKDGNWQVVQQPAVEAAMTTQEVPKVKHKLKNKALNKPDPS